MKVGVKFCGGCQSHYDRVELFNRLKDHFGDEIFQYVDESAIYKYLIVISGCPVQCADISKVKYEKTPLYIGNDNYKQAIELLEAYLKE